MILFCQELVLGFSDFFFDFFIGLNLLKKTVRMASWGRLIYMEFLPGGTERLGGIEFISEHKNPRKPALNSVMAILLGAMRYFRLSKYA